MSEKFNIFKLDNGIKYVHSKLDTTDLVTVAIFFRLGSIWETDEFYGGSHFLEHFLFKGCEKFKNAKDLNMEFDKIGAIVNASTGHEYTNFYGIISKEKFHIFFDIISNMVMTPVFNRDEFEKEKNVVTEELKRFIDLPQVASEEELYKIMFGEDHRLGRKIGGEVSDVKRIQIESLEKFHNKYYIPKNACISIVGNIDIDTVHEAVNKCKLAEVTPGELNVIKPVAINTENKFKLEIMTPENKQEHCYINIGFRTDTFDSVKQNKINFISNILNCGMSSRLFQDLRENHGISYSQNAGYETFIDTGVYVITTSVDCESIFKTNVNGKEKIGALEILSNQVNLLKNEAIGRDELEKVKACSLSHTRLSYEKCAKRCLRYGEDLILSKDDKILSIREEEEIYKNITSKEIMELANEIFDFNKCSICISGHLDKEKVDSLIKSKKLFSNK